MSICFSRPRPAMICCHSAIERPYFLSILARAQLMSHRSTAEGIVRSAGKYAEANLSQAGVRIRQSLPVSVGKVCAGMAVMGVSYAPPVAWGCGAGSSQWRRRKLCGRAAASDHHADPGLHGRGPGRTYQRKEREDTWPGSTLSPVRPRPVPATSTWRWLSPP